MHKVMRPVKGFAVRLWKDESGAALIEYSILIGLITAAVIATILAVGQDVGLKWTTLKNNLVGNQPN